MYVTGVVMEYVGKKFKLKKQYNDMFLGLGEKIVEIIEEKDFTFIVSVEGQPPSSWMAGRWPKSSFIGDEEARLFDEILPGQIYAEHDWEGASRRNRDEIFKSIFGIGVPPENEKEKSDENG